MPASVLQPLVLDEDDRYAPRHRLLLTTDAHHPDGTAFQVRLRDLSELGMLIEADAPLAVGTRIVVIHPTAGEIVATVTWSGNGVAGLQFARRLSPAMVSRAIRASSVVWLPTTARPRPGLDAAINRPTGTSPLSAAPLPISRRLQIVLGLSLALWGAIATTGIALIH